MQSFSVAIAAGIVLLVLGVFDSAVGQSTDSAPAVLPFCPADARHGAQRGEYRGGLRISVVCGVLVAIAAGIDFCRREVS